MSDVACFDVVTARAGQQFAELARTVRSSGELEFLDHDAMVDRYWARLATDFPDYQFGLVQKTTGAPLGIGHSLPLAFVGDWQDLPQEGLDWALETGFRGVGRGTTPTLVSALYILVSPEQRGKGLSATFLQQMKQVAADRGFRNLVAPVRPSMKARYPLIPIDEYRSWQTAGGEAFDPWLRVHLRAGGRMLHSCDRAAVVHGSRQQWAAWTGLEFPSDGRYVIPNGLVPLDIGRTGGEYVEPGIWVLHELEQPQAGRARAADAAR